MKPMKTSNQNQFAVSHVMTVVLPVWRGDGGGYLFHSTSGPNTPCQDSSFAVVSGNCTARPR